jgi:hypothetical protein
MENPQDPGFQDKPAAEQAETSNYQDENRSKTHTLFQTQWRTSQLAENRMGSRPAHPATHFPCQRAAAARPKALPMADGQTIAKLRLTMPPG